jgi:uncharacterized protein with HEPN domain
LSRADDERIADILDAARQIAEVVERGRQAWDDDRISQLAVERLLEIIGESARAMSSEARSASPEVPWADVIGLRVVLAHHYHRVDPAQVWMIATTDVPGLVEHLS